MAGFNEIDRVRTPKGQYVSASPLGGSGRPKRAIDAVPVPLVLVVAALLGYGLLVVWSAIQTNDELFVLASAHGRGNGCCRHAHLLFLRLSASCELHDAPAYRERGAHSVAAFARHWRREQRRAKLDQNRHSAAAGRVRENHRDFAAMPPLCRSSVAGSTIRASSSGRSRISRFRFCAS